MSFANIGKNGLPVTSAERTSQGKTGSTTNGSRASSSDHSPPSGLFCARCSRHSSAIGSAPSATGNKPAVILNDTPTPAKSPANRNQPRSRWRYHSSQESAEPIRAAAVAASAYAQPISEPAPQGPNNNTDTA